MKVAKYIIVGLISTFLINSCQKTENNSQSTQLVNSEKTGLVTTEGNTIETRFSLPEGYERKKYLENSYQFYLRTILLKPEGSEVVYYDGRVKNKDLHAAVLDIDIGDRDLQQCADAVMRLRAEYLFKQKKYTDIHFNFTNSFRADYQKWAEGYRVKMNGNKLSWVKSKEPDYSYDNFKKYIFYVYNYAGTLSLSQEMKAKKYADLEIGDVLIKGGSPGHAMTVMDVAINPENKKKIYLLSQSYMPAQSIHIVKNLNNQKISPWYELNEQETKIYTPEWTFKTTDLKTF